MSYCLVDKEVVLVRAKKIKAQNEIRTKKDDAEYKRHMDIINKAYNNSSFLTRFLTRPKPTKLMIHHLFMCNNVWSRTGHKCNQLISMCNMAEKDILLSADDVYFLFSGGAIDDN